MKNKVTVKEEPNLFVDITEWSIDNVMDHRRGSNFFRYDIIEFNEENVKWFKEHENIDNIEQYYGFWKTDTLIWDDNNGFDGESYSELTRVNKVEKITYEYVEVKS